PSPQTSWTLAGCERGDRLDRVDRRLERLKFLDRRFEGEELLQQAGPLSIERLLHGGRSLFAAVDPSLKRPRLGQEQRVADSGQSVDLALESRRDPRLFGGEELPNAVRIRGIERIELRLVERELPFLIDVEADFGERAEVSGSRN